MTTQASSPTTPVNDYVARRLADFVLAESRYRTTLMAAQSRGSLLFREAREAMGLTQRDMAVKLGVTNAWVCKIEKDRETAGPDVLLKLAYLVFSRQGLPKAAAGGAA